LSVNDQGLVWSKSLARTRLADTLSWVCPVHMPSEVSRLTEVTSEDQDDESLSGTDSSDDGQSDSVEPGLSPRGAGMLLITGMVGAGLMYLPQLPVRGGLFWSSFAMIICAITVGEGALTLYKAYAIYNSTHDDKIRAYVDYGHAGGGIVGASLIAFSVVIYVVVLLATYVSFIANQVTKNEDVHHIVSLVLLPVFLLLAMLKDVTYVAKLVPLGFAAAMLTGLLICVASLIDIRYWDHWPKNDQRQMFEFWPDDFDSVSLVFATIYGAFAIMTNVPVVLCNMQEPAKFPHVFRIVLGVVCVFYLLVMWCGYAGYGAFILDDIMDNMRYHPQDLHEALHTPYREWSRPQTRSVYWAMRVIVSINMFVSFPLWLMSVFDSLAFLRLPCCGKCAPYSCPNLMMRITVVFVIVALAIVIQTSNSDFYQLFSALFAPLLNGVFPVVFGFMIRRKQNAKKTGCCRKFIHAAIMLIALFCIVVGFHEAFVDLELTPCVQQCEGLPLNTTDLDS